MEDYPQIQAQEIPALTKAQMTEVDRLMLEDFHIELLQMMENAGRNLARLALDRFLRDRPGRSSAVILAGSGGNGGGAMACARRLHAWGTEASIVLTRPVSDHSGAPAHQLAALTQIGMPLRPAFEADPIRPPDLIIDGLIGYGISGEPRDAAAQWIEWANAQPAPILALDLPSGLDASLGPVHQRCIRAAATLTLAAPKRGLLLEDASDYVGELYLADIGVPPEVFTAMGIDGEWGHRFGESEILRIVVPENPRRAPAA